MAAGSLAYETLGEGPTVLLLHPVGLDSTFWRSAASILAARFRVVSPDLPGHGKSRLRDPAPATTADYAAIIANFIDNADGPAHAVIGLSFGGMIAQELALARPDLIGRLGLCGCTATFPDAVRPAIRERGALAEREGMAAVVDSTLARWFTEEFLARDGSNGVRARLLSDDVAGWATAWRAIATHDAQSRLKSLSVPTLCLAGEKDLASPPAAMRAMAEAIPQAGFAVLPHAPHMMHIETPAAFAGALSEFLA